MGDKGVKIGDLVVSIGWGPAVGGTEIGLKGKTLKDFSAAMPKAQINLGDTLPADLPLAGDARGDDSDDNDDEVSSAPPPPAATPCPQPLAGLAAPTPTQIAHGLPEAAASAPPWPLSC